MSVHMLFVGAGPDVCLRTHTYITYHPSEQHVFSLVPSGWEDELHPCMQGDQTRQGRSVSLSGHGTRG
jgi:hypothetical protein